MRGPLAGARLGVVAAIAALGIAAGLLAGWLVLEVVRPDRDRLQRAALEEVGLPPELESAVVVGPFLDAYSDKIERRILDESRPGASVAVVAAAAAAVATSTALHAADARRCDRRRPTRSRPGQR